MSAPCLGGEIDFERRQTLAERPIVTDMPTRDLAISDALKRRWFVFLMPSGPNQRKTREFPQLRAFQPKVAQAAEREFRA